MEERLRIEHENIKQRGAVWLCGYDISVIVSS